MSERPSRPNGVTGPTGKPLTVDSLPPPDTKRWVMSRKADVVGGTFNDLGSKATQPEIRPSLDGLLRNEDGVTERSDFLRSTMMPKGGVGIKSMVGSLQRFGACRRGTSSVEFVMVLAPMLLFLFGIIGFGLITYAHNNMVNAAREATRRLSVAEDVVNAADLEVACGSTAYDTVVTAAAALVPPMTAAEQIACDYLTDWAITFNVTATECDPAELAIDPNFRDVTVLITADASDAFMVDIWDLFTGDLEAEVTMRREYTCVTS